MVFFKRPEACIGMMLRAKDRTGYGKLLEAWEPPDNAGDPIGCLATSFNFSATFFEEECLSRFLDLESDPNEDGPVYLIEREEKLAGVICAAVLVDQHHCRGRRSLRWDLIPARPNKGILHAKISLLCWDKHIRAIVSSANITEEGYRRNQEIFGVLDFMDNGVYPKEFLFELIEFLKQCFEQSGYSAGNNSAAKRAFDLMNRARSMTKAWNLPQKMDLRRSPRVELIFSGPGRPSVFEGLRRVWKDISPPEIAIITSPFFDEEESNQPAKEIWKILNKRTKKKVIYQVVAEDNQGLGKIFIHAPETLKTSKPDNQRKAEVSFRKIDEVQSVQGKTEIRPLHLKSIWLENKWAALYMIGSSNFTSSGLGLGSVLNLEANIAYFASRERNQKIVRMLEQALIHGEELELGGGLEWCGSRQNEDTTGPDDVLLPKAFNSATYRQDELGRGFIDIELKDTPPVGWCIKFDQKPVIDETEWKENGSPELITLEWRETPPSGFEIYWKGTLKPAWLPVNVMNKNTLPPPEDLKDLSLDALIHILTSARPLHQVMRQWQKKQRGGSNEQSTPSINPHDRVDTSSFLLQRTRRVSFALDALRSRLERPVFTEESLNWRLRGPIGVLALARSIEKEAKSDQERAFILTELAVELSRVRPNEVIGSLSQSCIKRKIKEVIKEIKNCIMKYPIEDNYNLKRYIESILMEV